MYIYFLVREVMIMQMGISNLGRCRYCVSVYVVSWQIPHLSAQPTKGEHYIVLHGQTVLFYHNSSVWRDMGYIHGEFSKFPGFFVQAFKIVVDSWKFTMLLLYNLWDDDWPVFMFSGSNEQLQQQLEYTLLKTDCHTWWISKM